MIAEEGMYQLTERGTTIRQTAEATTDAYFFEPWACLTKAELGLIYQLLLQLGIGLRQVAESA